LGLALFLVVTGLYLLILSVVVPKEEMVADMETDPATA
jgi:SSS family solute:Na+ symporter